MKLVVITDTGERVDARCDRCRHWDSEPSGLIRVGHELDYRGAEIPGYGRCSAAVWLYGQENDDPGDAQAFVADIDHSGAALATKPDHWCSLFGAKEA